MKTVTASDLGIEVILIELGGHAARDYLFKPWSIDELAEAIDQALHSAPIPLTLPAASDHKGV